MTQDNNKQYVGDQDDDNNTLTVKAADGKKLDKVTDENGVPVNGTVLIGLNGKKYKAIVKDGIATVDVILPKSPYTLVVYYEGDNNYNSSYVIYKEGASYKEEVSSSTDLSKNNAGGNMENTGNPLLVLLIALAAIGIESFRRKF